MSQVEPLRLNDVSLIFHKMSQGAVWTRLRTTNRLETELFTSCSSTSFFCLQVFKLTSLYNMPRFPGYLVASPRLLSGVAAVMQGRMPTFTRVLQHENEEQASQQGFAWLFILS